MANTFSCTGEKCLVLDGGVKKCTAKNCEDRTPYNADEFFNHSANRIHKGFDFIGTDDEEPWEIAALLGDI